MLLKNLELQAGSRSLVNGSRGVVVGFEAIRGDNDSSHNTNNNNKSSNNNSNNSNLGIPIVRFKNGVERVMIREVFSTEVFLEGKCVRKQVGGGGGGV